MSDVLMRGNSMDGTIRVFVAITTDTVNEAHKIHNTAPVVSAALGRTLTGAAMMGAMLKSDSDSVNIQIKGDGPIKYLTTIADKNGNVKGYVQNPFVDMPLNSIGKLDVGGAIGQGYLGVIRDLGLKEPWTGTVPLVSGEIAEDLTSYFAQSEQTPTAIGLGVLVNTDCSILASGGYMIQLMPDATEETAIKLEKILKDLPPITTMINDGMLCEDIIFRITDGFDMLISNEELPIQYKCDCSLERMERVLRSIGRDELRKILDEDGKAELCCHFCNNKYTFDKATLEKLYDELNKKN